MAKLLHTLKDTQLRHWMKQGEPVGISDGNGLTFTLSKAGTASWTLRYRQNGTRKELTLGNYPDISLADARRLASLHRAAVDQGADPAKEKATRKKKEATPEWTVKTLADDYKAKRLLPSEFANGTIYIRKRDLDKVIVPRIGSLPVAEVTGQHIVKMLADAGRTWTISNQVLTTASKLFEHAAGMRLVHIDPCAGVSLVSLFGPRPTIRRRVMLSEADLRKLLVEVDTLGTVNATALRILLATCVRTNELTNATWQNVNLDTGSWYVPDEATKTRNGFYVPLMPPVIQWFQELKTIAGDSPFVLPARDVRREGQPITERTLWAAITRGFDDGRLTVTRFTPHDFRSTAKSTMRNLGVPEFDTERALNHAIPGISGVYDVRDELPEKRKALQIWADHLLTLSSSA